MKKSRQKGRATSKAVTVLPDLTTYSIRLNGGERELLTNALSAKGWTPTHFIRQATLEKAAQVDNTSKFTKFDFESLARRLARQLCQVQAQYWQKSEPAADASGPYSFEEMQERIPDLEATHETIDPPRFAKAEVETLRDAIKLGGTEFLRRVLEECDRIVKSPDELPSPIDPAQFV